MQNINIEHTRTHTHTHTLGNIVHRSIRVTSAGKQFCEIEEMKHLRSVADPVRDS